MNNDTPSIRRQFIREGGTLLLAAAGLAAAGASTAHAETAEDPCECIQGNVLLRHQDGTAIMYTAASNTDSARWSALQAALTHAKTLTGRVTLELLQGNFLVPTGVPLMYYVDYLEAVGTPSGTYAYDIRVGFRDGAALIYQTPADAQADWRLFPGRTRLGKNFGAVSDDPSSTDMTPRIRAALYSMPPTGEPVEVPSGYTTWKTRSGVLYLEGGSYRISDTIFLTSNQSIVGNSVAVLKAAEGFAPDSGSEKWMIQTLRWNGGGTPTANFNFDIRIIRIKLANEYATNTKVSGVLYGCGQGGEVDISTFNMGHRGMKLLPATSHCRISMWSALTPWAPHNRVQTGPHLEIISCFALKFGVVDLEGLNAKTAGNRANYTPDFAGATPINLPGMVVYNSYNLLFDSIAGETSSSLAFFWSCREIQIGGISHQAANPSGVGATLLWLHDCHDYFVGGLSAAYFEYLYRITGGALEEAEDYFVNNAPFAHAGPITERSRSFNAVISTLNFVRRDKVNPSTDSQAFTFYNGTKTGYPTASGCLTLEDGNKNGLMEVKNGYSLPWETGRQISTGYGVCVGRAGALGLLSRAKIKAVQGYEALSGAGNPTTADVPPECATDWINTTTGQASRWINRNGTMKCLGVYV